MNEKGYSAYDTSVARVHLRMAINQQLDCIASYREWEQDAKAAGRREMADTYNSLAKGAELDVESLQRVLEFLE